MSIERPLLPLDFDRSRAAARRAEPDGWRFGDAAIAAVYAAIEGRRDIRRFRPEPVPEPTLGRILGAAHAAPSVGLMQPWRFVVVRSAETKAAMQGIAQKQRLAQAPYLDARAREYLDLKLEGIGEAPVSVVVCCDRRPGEEILGRHTIPDTDLYSTCLAIQNLWLAARAEGLGIGWVSFYEEDEVRGLLGIPVHVVPVAWLCVGYPDERPVRPGLEAAGWGRRDPLAAHVYEERWQGGAGSGDAASGDAASGDASGSKAPAAEALCSKPAPEDALGSKAPFAAPLCSATHDTGAGTPPANSSERHVPPADHGAAVAARDRSDELIKPLGSLGALETLIERWAAATGAPPPADPRAAILVLAADHGVAAQGTSLYPQRVSGQIAAAAARGESAIGVLAAAHGARLEVADLGLIGPHPPGVTDRRVSQGTADITRGPAMTAAQLNDALEAGAALANALLDDDHDPRDLLILGEIGIANTTVASALASALTGVDPTQAAGRGAGLDAQGVTRKAAVIATALAANHLDPTASNHSDPPDALEILRRVGGLEFAGLVGAMHAAARRRTPILLDGFATGVAALIATRIEPATRDYLFAGHRSAEPAHARILVELGLDPLLDQRLRLGEASGAALALPLIGLCGRLHRQMGTFADARVNIPT